MSKRLAGLVGWAFLGWAGFAQALGLGEIESRSHLNQQVFAAIPILSASAEEIDSLVVELATNDEFERAGMERAEFLSALRFSVENQTILVKSKTIAREPFVSFLLSVRWSGGRLLREYTLLLDPPNLARGTGISPPVVAPQAEAAPPAEAAPGEPVPTEAPPAEAPTEAPGEAPATAEAAPAPEAAPAAPMASAEGGSYGPVSPKETLWSIAYKLRPDPATITMDQMQVAIFNANPKAFHGGQITGLMKGSMLRIPGADEIRAVDPVSAKALVARARQGSAVAAAAPPPAPPAEAAPPPAEAAPPPPPSAAEAPPPPPTPEAAPPSEAAAAGAPPPSEAAPSGAPPPSETAAAPPTETPPPAPAPTEAPVETQPAPAPAPEPSLLEKGQDILQSVISAAKNAVEDERVKYGLAGLVGLIVLALVGKKVADKIAQARYNRASKQVEAARTGAAAAPALGDSEVTQVAPEAEPSLQAALAAAADAPTVVSGPRLAATVAMGSDTLQQTMQQTQVSEPPQAQTGGRAVDFDVTSNFASETVQINLDAGDPLSEAEFHRAYGLYDEAALMLKQALQKDPKRTDARVKLAEIYFEAGKANEFVETAKELKSQLPADKWQPIALMGSQIAPTNELFSGAGAGGVGGAVDLSFDEPAAAAPAAAPAPAPAPAAAAPAAEALEFDLGSLSLDTGAAAAPAAAPAAAAPGGEAVEFDLGGLSLETPAAAAPAAAPAPPVTALAAGADMGLDLGNFDLGAAAPEAAAAPAVGGEVVELSTEVISDLNAAAGDETSTKLDLARAYLDMGDADMAKSLLNEVSQQGNEAQKKEAEELLKRASA